MANRSLQSILLIDDDAMVQFLNKKLIAKSRYAVEVVGVTGGKEAMELMRSDDHNIPKPCLILLDLNMPGWTGWDFLERFENLSQSQKEHCTIMILSTSENPADLKRASRIPLVKRYISKPLSTGLLEEIVQERWPETARL